jgi:hypothetical protein
VYGAGSFESLVFLAVPHALLCSIIVLSFNASTLLAVVSVTAWPCTGARIPSRSRSPDFDRHFPGFALSLTRRYHSITVRPVNGTMVRAISPMFRRLGLCSGEKHGLDESVSVPMVGAVLCNKTLNVERRSGVLSLRLEILLVLSYIKAAPPHRAECTDHPLFPALSPSCPLIKRVP